MSERPVVPEGFTTLNITEPFSTRVGPIYGRRDGDMLRLGFVVDASHLNIEGVAHGVDHGGSGHRDEHRACQ